MILKDIIIYLKISDPMDIKNFRDWIIDLKNKNLLPINITGSHGVKYYKNTNDKIYKGKIILHLQYEDDIDIYKFNIWLKSSLWSPNIIETKLIKLGDIY